MKNRLNKLNKSFVFTLVLSLICSVPTFSQEKVTGLSNVKLFLDPGHALKENQGLYKYSEAEKTLRVAKAIKEYLVTYTDIPADNVKLCREDDDTQATLTQRTDMANAWGANFYYSIHSDAGATPTSANTTLIMYGGWRVSGTIYEKTPNGGKDYGELLAPNLTGVMPLVSGTRGNVADRTYYDAAQTHTNHYPYLHVNRESNMASLLSEGGFHTHYAQQALNLNAEYKRLEGYAAYQSLVKFLSAKYGAAAVNPVQIGIATGIITDGETGTPINGAVVTISNGFSGKNYTTDTYESLFNKHSNNPNELHNGFYFIEGLTPGTTVNVTVEATGYQTQQTTLAIPATIGATTKDGIGIKNFSMLNILPAVVSGVEPENLAAVPVEKPIILTFSRKMDRASVEAAISILPADELSYSWTNDYTLRVNVSKLNFQTDYALTIDGTVAKNAETNNFLDGNADGTEGGNYVLNFKTGEQDTTAPFVVSYGPESASLQEESARPIVRIEFSEPLNQTTIAPNQITVTDANGETVGGTQRYATVNGKSVLHYFFSADLDAAATYTVNLADGIEDLYGNAIAAPLQYTFTARPREVTVTTVLDNFNTLASTWWTPNASGSTAGIDTNVTTFKAYSAETSSVGNAGSVQLNYLWDESKPSHVIREHSTATSPKFSKDNVVQFYVFGDGSYSKVAVALRNAGAGTIWTNVPVIVDWVGWKLISWDLTNDPFTNWLVGSGSDPLPVGSVLNLSALRFEGAAAGKIAYTPSYVLFDELKAVQLGNFITTGVNEVKGDKEIIVTTASNAIQVSAANTITDVKVYSLTGALVKTAQPAAAAYSIATAGWSKGVYVVKVSTEVSQATVKVIVK